MAKESIKTSQEPEIDIGEHLRSSCNILFLDLSSSCTGYSLANVNFETKEARFLNAGAIWFNKDLDNQEKYHYLYCAIVNYFNIIGKIDFCVAEAYIVNMNKVMGCQVGPELHGALQVALAEIGVKYKVIHAQTWRKELGVKKDEKGDYKVPTKLKVEDYVAIPEEIASNVTGGMRKTPNDLTDAIGIGIGMLKKLGFTKFNFTNMKIQESIDILN